MRFTRILAAVLLAAPMCDAPAAFAAGPKSGGNSAQTATGRQTGRQLGRLSRDARTQQLLQQRQDRGTQRSTVPSGSTTLPVTTGTETGDTPTGTNGDTPTGIVNLSRGQQQFQLNQADRLLAKRLAQADHLRDIALRNGNEKLLETADRMEQIARAQYARRVPGGTTPEDPAAPGEEPAPVDPTLPGGDPTLPEDPTVPGTDPTLPGTDPVLPEDPTAPIEDPILPGEEPIAPPEGPVELLPPEIVP
jgi:hypothetical protein